MVSITLITGKPLEKKAKLAVFKTMLDPSKTSIRVWPFDDIDAEKLDSFADTNEFWVTPDATGCSVLKFGDDGEVFGVSDIDDWTWFLNHEYPKAIVYLLPKFGTLPDMLAQKEYCQPPFKLPMLKSLFHDMKNQDDPQPQICRKIAKWLASLKCPILKPFEFIQHEKHWKLWDAANCDSHFRSTRAGILADSKPEDIICGNSKYFWLKICEQYHRWAIDGISEQTRSNLEQAMKLWQ